MLIDIEIPIFLKSIIKIFRVIAPMYRDENRHLHSYVELMNYIIIYCLTLHFRHSTHYFQFLNDICSKINLDEIMNINPGTGDEQTIDL